MTCTNCEEMRERLREALLARKLGSAIGVVAEAVVFRMTGAEREPVDKDDLGTDGRVSQKVRGHVQGKRAGRGPRNYPASGEGRTNARQDGVPAGVPDGLDSRDAENQPGGPAPG